MSDNLGLSALGRFAGIEFAAPAVGALVVVFVLHVFFPTIHLACWEVAMSGAGVGVLLRLPGRYALYYLRCIELDLLGSRLSKRDRKEIKRRMTWRHFLGVR